MTELDPFFFKVIFNQFTNTAIRSLRHTKWLLGMKENEKILKGAENLNRKQG